MNTDTSGIPLYLTKKKNWEQVDVIEHLVDRQKLNELFFSPKNIKNIQELTKKEIYYRSKGKFLLTTDQDEDDLLISMRFVYLEYSKFIPCQYEQQIKELNKTVVNYIVPDMITAIKQQHDYLNDISRPLQPNPLPMNVHFRKQVLPSTLLTKYHSNS